jgi:hypothetical protein
VRTPAPLPEEDPRYEPEDPYDGRKPGVAQTPKSAAEKVGIWVGLGVFTWALLLGLLWLTVKVTQSLF